MCFVQGLLRNQPCGLLCRLRQRRQQPRCVIGVVVTVRRCSGEAGRVAAAAILAGRDAVVATAQQEGPGVAGARRREGPASHGMSLARRPRATSRNAPTTSSKFLPIQMRRRPLVLYRSPGCLQSSSLDAGGPRVGWPSAEIHHGRGSFADGGTGNTNWDRSSISTTVRLDGQTSPGATPSLSDSLDMPAAAEMLVARREREEEGMVLIGMGPTSAFIARGGQARRRAAEPRR
ncbi:hypothetical protein ZWY2020_058653 [Hordeum vulgare]|nr:hypothetical protein ZWY2020_058653 [Hordeum vulgare]